jgi:hypothetical protein
MKKNFQIILLICIFALTNTNQLFAQGEHKYITFSGMIMDSQTKEPLPGAYITIPSAGRGTLSDAKGYFLLAVFPGDTIVFSYLGFKKQFHVIPKKTDLDYSVFVELQVDSKILKEVKVYPFRTEEEFKQALVDMKLPDERERKILDEVYNPQNVARMAAIHGMNSEANYRYAMNLQQIQAQNRGFLNTNPLFSPTAWWSFVQSIRKGNWKDKSWKAGVEAAPREKVTRDEFFRNGKN